MSTYLGSGREFLDRTFKRGTWEEGNHYPGTCSLDPHSPLDPSLLSPFLLRFLQGPKHLRSERGKSSFAPDAPNNFGSFPKKSCETRLGVFLLVLTSVDSQRPWSRAKPNPYPSDRPSEQTLSQGTPISKCCPLRKNSTGWGLPGAWGLG